MTRKQYTETIHQELRALNERIDYKILHGLRYRDDARRHHMLRKSITRQRTTSFWSRLIPSFLSLQ